ncbi:hypothetical protein BSNK01_21320 [Bacillaceae bacterium]
MYINKKSAFGLFLICAGAIILLSSLGFDFWGGLMGYLLPILISALGYYGIKKGNRFFGWILFAIGVMMLLGKMTWIVGVLIAIGMMAYGISIWKRQHSY